MHRLPVIIVLLCLLVSCGSQEEQAVKQMYKPTDTTLLEFFPLNKPEKYGWMWVYPDRYCKAFLNMNIKNSKSWEYLPGDSILIFNGDAFATMEHYMFYDDLMMWSNDGLIHVFAINTEKFGIIIQPGMTTIYRLVNQHFVPIGKVADAVVKTPCSIHFCDFNFDGYTDLVLRPNEDATTPAAMRFTCLLYNPALKEFRLLEGNPVEHMALSKRDKAIYESHYGENKDDITIRKYHLTGNRLVCEEAIGKFSININGAEEKSRIEHWTYKNGKPHCDSVIVSGSNALGYFNEKLSEHFATDQIDYLGWHR